VLSLFESAAQLARVVVGHIIKKVRYSDGLRFSFQSDACYNRIRAAIRPIKREDTLIVRIVFAVLDLLGCSGANWVVPFLIPSFCI